LVTVEYATASFPSVHTKIIVDDIESHPFHPEIEDDWLLANQAIDPKRPNLTSFFPKRGKGDREKVLNSLSGFDCTQPSSSYLALLTPRARGAASLMARFATPDVRHPICNLSQNPATATI
jgi:hypothetical protein